MMADRDQHGPPPPAPVYRARRILIVGCGELGSSLAIMLSDSGNIVRVLDKNDQAFKLLPKERIDTARILP